VLLDYVHWLAAKFGAKIEWVDSLGAASVADWNHSPSRQDFVYIGNDTFWFRRGCENDPSNLLHEVHHYIVADADQRAERGFGYNMTADDEIEVCRMDIYTLGLFDRGLADRWRRYTHMEDDREPMCVRTKRQIRDDVARFKRAYVKQNVHA
jgi:hypothetical protein